MTPFVELIIKSIQTAFVDQIIGEMFNDLDSTKIKWMIFGMLLTLLVLQVVQ